MMRIGGLRFSIVRTCIGDVCGTENDIVRDIEGVLRVARRMILRDVQRLEVVVVELDLRAFRDREAKTEENLLELVEDDVQRMLLANHDLVARKGNVNGLGSELFSSAACSSSFFCLSMMVSISARTSLMSWPTTGRSSAATSFIPLEQSGQLALLTEELDTRFIEGACIRAAASCSFADCKMPCSFSFISILLWNVMFMPGRKRKKPSVPLLFADIGTKGITLPWYHPDFRMLGHSLNAGNGASTRLCLLPKAAVQHRCSQGNFTSCLMAWLTACGRALWTEKWECYFFLFIALEYS